MEKHNVLCSILKMSLKWQEEEQQRTFGKPWKETREEVALTKISIKFWKQENISDKWYDTQEKAELCWQKKMPQERGHFTCSPKSSGTGKPNTSRAGDRAKVKERGLIKSLKPGLTMASSTQTAWWHLLCCHRSLKGHSAVCFLKCYSRANSVHLTRDLVSNATESEALGWDQQF